ncbi:MAG: bifunctional ornithine acetyltransferase/N-acetylglutamate synthase, partial [Alphaproteobacteria bacterium]|nr:bifunctional ornithine acetyltransferase/N-acetylglutamate synthase [Alphaproteobacteria bacterium]
MTDVVSPLAPETAPALPVVAGVRLAVHACGIRYKGRPDLLMAEFAPETTVAGVFTRSLTCSAPVDWSRAAAATGRASVLLVNSGNANAFTGSAGMTAVQRTADAAAAVMGCAPTAVQIASTGVIGVVLDETRITENLAQVRASLSATAWPEAARAIMTTDTYPKLATRTAMIDGVAVQINGIAKGSGMIAPDMATMLGFVFTDAAIGPEVLGEMLRRGVKRSFNCITVDSDTSTSDTLLMFATGQAAHTRIKTHKDAHLKDFR